MKSSSTYNSYHHHPLQKIIMAEVGRRIVRFTYTGEDGEVIDDEATHITVAESCTFVRAMAFARLIPTDIVEMICHDKVIKIGSTAFAGCFLRRVIMPGVKVAEDHAFAHCPALTCIECGKLEIIGEDTFIGCESLESINLPSARVVGEGAFDSCKNLTNVKFGKDLESIGRKAFLNCSSLERITIPLKENLITADNIFTGCKKLKHVDLAEGEVDETIAALHLEEWRNDMNEEIDSINQILSDTIPGNWNEFPNEFSILPNDVGGKARAIRRWIKSVLRNIIHYQTEHDRLLDEVATTLQLALPRDIMVRVLPFLALPPHTFEVRGRMR